MSAALAFGLPALRAPFPWFGGKSRAAPLIWAALGDVPNYVEPFAGSIAVLLSRPHAPSIETINDLDAYLTNFWRAVQSQPDEVARWADWPVSEVDLHARHQWLVDQTGFRERMSVDPEYCDAKIAGWWVWGICQWIGSGWCAPDGWTHRVSETASGIQKRERKRPNLGRGGRGVLRQSPDLSGSRGAAGRGLHASGLASKTILGGDNKGVHGCTPIIEWMRALQARLRRTRFCCGDWRRILGPAPTTCIGVTGVLLDPPYGTEANRTRRLYVHDALDIAADVRAWCAEHGDDPKLRIALCGYAGEHEQLEQLGWRVRSWHTNGGYANARKGSRSENKHRERIWFSPHCLPLDRTDLTGLPLLQRAPPIGIGDSSEEAAASEEA